jgi:hypothetical protein
MTYGQKRKNVEVGCVEGQRSVAQPEEFSGSEERGGIRVDAGSRQEEVDQTARHRTPLETCG